MSLYHRLRRRSSHLQVAVCSDELCCIIGVREWDFYKSQSDVERQSISKILEETNTN